MRLRMMNRLKAILSVTILVVTASSAAWAHPVTTHDRSATTHDRAPQYHDHSAATRRGR
ncbi:MAG TPA: hypothetical protein VLI45_04435 [Acidobacteriaceae bacterium]|nr:hypothetical protein [Acidobacteriaceae bacterium]